MESEMDTTFINYMVQNFGIQFEVLTNIDPETIF